MSKDNIAKDILEEILKIFSSIILKMNESFYFHFEYADLSRTELKKHFPEISFEKKNSITFETNDLYINFIKKIFSYIGPSIIVNLHSSYSALYLRKIIRYLQQLLESNVNIVEDDLVKIFFVLLFLYFDESTVLESKKNSNREIDLDETFFKGTFIELTEKYSSQVPYQDCEEITDFINVFKKKMEKQITKLIDYTFQYIREVLKKYGNDKDETIISMYNDAGNILYELDTSKNILSEILINKINSFFSKKYDLIFTNYISESEELRNHINKEFLEKIEKEYLPSEFNFSLKNNPTFNLNHNNKLEDYIEYKNRFYKRMEKSCLSEIFKCDLNKEINIFAFSTYIIDTQYSQIQNFKHRMENLEQKKILQIIKDILNENNFYEHYFSILRCDIIKKFFTSNLYVNENDKEFQLQKDKSKDSECFEEIYLNFLKEYDKKNENYQEFKNLIILKILPSGDRAYTMKYFKKIIINPAQFFLGKEIEKGFDIKMILKGYLIVILLHETEHFFRLLDKNKKVFPLTPREKEGGRMFIKYLFDVQTINHINEEQAKFIFDNEIWKDHKKLKKIFFGQLEDIEEDNINDFLLNYFTDSISFFTTNEKGKNHNKKFKLNEFLRK